VTESPHSPQRPSRVRPTCFWMIITTVEALGIMRAIRTINWDRLGKRVVAIYTLYVVGIASMVALTLLTVRMFNAKRLFVCVSILVAWGTLLVTRTITDDWCSHRQVGRILARFEQAALALNDKWPTGPGEVPPGIRFDVSPELYPDVLMLRGHRDPYSFDEDLGLTIRRGHERIIRFDLAAALESCVEYHPNGTRPSAHTSAFGYPSPPVASVRILKENWFLVRYGS
jgi:hypothetical protein